MYDTWEDIKHFIGALFPKVDINYVYEGLHVDVSDFEKVLLCIMRARRYYDITTLAIIIGRDMGMVSRYGPMDAQVRKGGFLPVHFRYGLNSGLHDKCGMRARGNSTLQQSS